MLFLTGKLHIMDELVTPLPIQTIFNGWNYILWALKMSSIWRGRRLWHYVTDDIHESTEPADEFEDKFVEQLDGWDSKNH